MKNLNFSPKGPTTFKIWKMKRCLSLITKMERTLPLMGWLQNYSSKKASTIFWNVYTFELMNWDEYQGLSVRKSLSSFSYNFTANYLKVETYIFVTSNYQSFIS